MDGCTLDTEAEKERVIKCIEAAIQRRVSEVLCLKISMFFCEPFKDETCSWVSLITYSYAFANNK